MPVDFGWLGLPLLNHVHCCQWRALLRALPPQSVDMLFADMPYNTTACDWDDYVVPLDAFWRHVRRVMKPRGAVVLTGSQPFTSKLVTSNLEWFRYEWVWEKSIATQFLDANRKPMKRHENVLYFADAPGLYNPQFDRATPYFTNPKSRPTSVYHNHYRVKTTNNTGQRYPTTIIKFTNSRGLHLTQKPVSLLEYLIHTYTNPGDLVVDPFAGSGTTAVAAANTGRAYIVGDISPEYCEIARRRLSMEFGRPAPRRARDEAPDLGPLFSMLGG